MKNNIIHIYNTMSTKMVTVYSRFDPATREDSWADVATRLATRLFRTSDGTDTEVYTRRPLSGTRWSSTWILSCSPSDCIFFFNDVISSTWAERAAYRVTHYTFKSIHLQRLTKNNNLQVSTNLCLLLCLLISSWLGITILGNDYIV